MLYFTDTDISKVQVENSFIGKDFHGVCLILILDKYN